eukprot:3933747-Rhodomonas_salina.1
MQRTEEEGEEGDGDKCVCWDSDTDGAGRQRDSGTDGFGWHGHGLFHLQGHKLSVLFRSFPRLSAWGGILMAINWACIIKVTAAPAALPPGALPPAASENASESGNERRDWMGPEDCRNTCLL